MPKFATKIAVAIVALVGMQCATLSQVNLLSTQEEVELGRQFSQEIEAELKMYDDPIVNAYVDSLGQLLVSHSDRTDIEYHIKVVDTDEVNAFAIPGGWLYVNRGLISVAESESELTAVMGHEIGHIVGYHSARQISSQYGLSIIAQVALGQDPGMLRQMVTGLLAQGAMMKYSRDMEREADKFGIEENYRAGIDPGGMQEFFKKLRALEGGGGTSDLEKFFSTHPPTQERIDSSARMVASLPGKPNLTVNTTRFQQIKNRLPKRASGS